MGDSDNVKGLDLFTLGLLPYQIKWLQDNSRFKIAEKSRRIGWTFGQSFEDTCDVLVDKRDVWFASADESAAKEYILYCKHWIDVLGIIAEDLGEQVIDKERDVKALSIQFSNDKRINALSSNPKNFRSKGGKVVLDEFAFHNDQDAMWKAAAASAMQKDKIRVISTYNGKGNRYYRMVQAAKQGKSKWSCHTVTIEDALNDGLLGALGFDDTPKDREEFLHECRYELAGDEDTFQQEFMCNPSDETSAWLPFSLITPAEREDAGVPELYTGTPVYVGMDIGRKSDATVIHVLEKMGDVFWVRERTYAVGETFANQHAMVDSIFTRYKVAKMHIDATGLGMNFAEDVQKKYGTAVVQDVTFTNVTKHHLANTIKQRFEDIQIRIPINKILQDSLHAIKKTKTETTSAPKFDADRNAAGHADDFWALALALDAATMPYQELTYTPCGNPGDGRDADAPDSSWDDDDHLGSGSVYC